MTPCQSHLLGIIQRNREDLIRDATEVTFSPAYILTPEEVIMPRDEAAQLLRGVLAIVEEGVAGTAHDVRDNFLDIMPEIARASTWELTLKHGLASWGVIIGKLVASSDEAHREEATVFLARFMGIWWSEVARVTMPVYMAKGAP